MYSKLLVYNRNKFDKSKSPQQPLAEASSPLDLVIARVVKFYE